MRNLAVCATCNYHLALHRTYRRWNHVRRDRNHSNCMACHRNLMNQYRHRSAKEVQ